jgi:hypothetical protein
LRALSGHLNAVQIQTWMNCGGWFGGRISDQSNQTFWTCAAAISRLQRLRV